jgi:hypothetical protein
MRSRFLRGISAAGIMAAVSSGTARDVTARAASRHEAVAVTATAEVDGKHYDYSGPGECYYSAGGALYEQPATMWHATFQARNNPMAHANLAIWQMKRDGSTRLNLFVMVGNASYGISTSQPGAAKGTAAAGAENHATGGRLQAEGRTAEGRLVKISIACSRFDAPEDNGD